MYFTGIGSRQISESDKYKIEEISEFLSDYNLIVVSGNADGADICWQENNQHLVILPWDEFNFENFVPDNYYVPIIKSDAKESVENYHPNPSALSKGAKMLMQRNYYQIFPRNKKTSFVLYVADEEYGEVKGGTGQAVRIAQDNRIPTFNVRQNTIDDFKEWFKDVLII